MTDILGMYRDEAVGVDEAEERRSDGMVLHPCLGDEMLDELFGVGARVIHLVVVKD